MRFFLRSFLSVISLFFDLIKTFRISTMVDNLVALVCFLANEFACKEAVIGYVEVTLVLGKSAKHKLSVTSKYLIGSAFSSNLILVCTVFILFNFVGCST